MLVKTGFEDRKARVEFLPLIDVVFLLLVFFIYAMLSMVVHRGIEVSLPTGSSTQVSQLDYVNITIDAQNQISVNGKPIAMDMLVTHVQTAQQKLQHAQDKAPIFISGDKTSNLGIALTVLDQLRRAGMTEVSFELEKNKP